jgi:hypothetical protein
MVSWTNAKGGSGCPTSEPAATHPSPWKGEAMTQMLTPTQRKYGCSTPGQYARNVAYLHQIAEQARAEKLARIVAELGVTSEMVTELHAPIDPEVLAALTELEAGR